jgi:P-type conjugative transfer protein TrbJ
MKRIILSALLLICSHTASAGIPVFDGANLAQAITQVVSWGEQLNQMTMQIKNQLDQYQQMAQNMVNPDYWGFGDVQKTADQLMSTANSLRRMQEDFGSLDDLLAQFQTFDKWQDHPCYKPEGCTDAQFEELKEQQLETEQQAQVANEQVMYTMSDQATRLEEDAARLAQIQQQAQSAQGNQQAIQATNQILGNAAEQLMSLRAMMLATATAETTKNQIEANRLAQQRAADAAALERIKVVPTPKFDYSPSAIFK